MLNLRLVNGFFHPAPVSSDHRDVHDDDDDGDDIDDNHHNHDDDDEDEEDQDLEMGERVLFKSERSAKFPEEPNPLDQSLSTISQVTMMTKTMTMMMMMAKMMMIMTMTMTMMLSL